MKKILHIHVKRKYWEKVKSGTKKEEYRAVTDYWVKRLIDKNYDEIHYKLGYPKKSDKSKILIFPYNRYKFKNIKNINHELFEPNQQVFVIALNKAHKGD